MISVEAYIDDVSQFGLYQLLQLTLCFFSIFATTSQTLSTVFTAQVPKFLCNDFDFTNANFTNTCFTNGSCPSLLFSQDMRTVVTKYGLVCDRVYLVPLISTLYMIGFFWGGTIYGHVSDRFGRRHGCLFSGLHTVICSLVAVFAPNYFLYAAFRLLTAVGTSGQLAVVFTYCAECASSNNRALFLTVCQMPWSVCLFFMCLVSFLLQDQTYIDLICAAFSLSSIAIFCMCYESPRWLISQGRAEETKTVLEKISKINRKPVVIDAEEFRKQVSIKLASEAKAKKQQVSLKDLLVNPGMRRLTLSLWFIDAVVSLVYYGFFYGISSLDGMSIYAQVMIGAGIELVITPCLYPVLKHCERLWLRILCFVVVGSFTFAVCILIAFPFTSVVITVLCSIARPVGGFLLTFETLYTVEIYPTTHRTLGVGSMVAAERLGSILATQLVSLGLIWRPGPYVLISTGCLIVILLTCFLPESKYSPCPETVDEAVATVNRHRFYREQLCCQGMSDLGRTQRVVVQDEDMLML